MKRKIYSSETRQKILAKIQTGRKVSAVTAEYGVKETTVRNWLSRDTGVIFPRFC